MTLALQSEANAKEYTRSLASRFNAVQRLYSRTHDAASKQGIVQSLLFHDLHPEHKAQGTKQLCVQAARLDKKNRRCREKARLAQAAVQCQSRAKGIAEAFRRAGTDKSARFAQKTDFAVL